MYEEVFPRGQNDVLDRNMPCIDHLVKNGVSDILMKELRQVGDG